MTNDSVLNTYEAVEILRSVRILRELKHHAENHGCYGCQNILREEFGIEC